MKLTKQIYTDDKGNIWEVEKCSLPKKRGEYKFWIAECVALSKSYRELTKSGVLKRIKFDELQK